MVLLSKSIAKYCRVMFLHRNHCKLKSMEKGKKRVFAGRKQSPPASAEQF